MKHPVVILFQLALIFIVFMSCKTDKISKADESEKAINIIDTSGAKLIIKIRSKTFLAILADNPAASAFKARLPLTIPMDELNGNEKLYRFSTDLPGNPSNPGTIQNGDLMLYNSNVLVLFYKTFPTSYSYTRIGKINDITGLAAALGAGGVTVNFALE